MPLYDMKCQNCKSEIEVFCRIAERNDQICPICNFKALTILMSTPTDNDWFRAHMNESLGDYDSKGVFRPVEVRTREHYKQLCLKQGVTPRCMGDVRNITEI